MNFGKAIELVKKGYKVQRNGWNGKNQYIELATCISYKNADGKLGRKAREKVMETFAISIVAEQYNNLYRTL